MNHLVWVSSRSWLRMACINSYSWAICSSGTVESERSMCGWGPGLTAHLVYFGLVHLRVFPGVALELLGVHLPLGQEANLHGVRRWRQCYGTRVGGTMWMGLSTFLWARNSALRYSSPSRRM